MNGSVPRESMSQQGVTSAEIKGLSVYAEKPMKLAPCPGECVQDPVLSAYVQEPMQQNFSKEPLLKSSLQEPMVNNIPTVGVKDVQELKLRLDDAQAQLKEERSNTRKLEKDMKRVQ